MGRRLLAAVLAFGALATPAVAQQQCEDVVLGPTILVGPRDGNDIAVRGGYASADDAAVAALYRAWDAHFQYRKDTGGDEVEFGGYVVRTEDGDYGYTDPYPGAYFHTDDAWMLGDDLDPLRLITGEEVVGDYHIHPPTTEQESGTWDENEWFSPRDIDHADAMEVPTYLRTPESWIRYDPETEQYRVFTPEEDGSFPPESTSSADEIPPSTGDTGASADESGSGSGGCAARPGGGSIFGEPHLLSFDGARLDFHAAGEFTAAEALDDDFVLAVRLEPYLNSRSVSVLTGLGIRVDDQRIGIHTEAPHYRVNGRDAQEEYGTRLSSGVALTGEVTISLREGLFTVTTRTGDRIRVRRPFSEWLDVAVTLADSRRGRMRGLLGDYDGDSTNDLVTREGQTVSLAAGSHGEFIRRLYRVWGDSWRIGDGDAVLDHPEGVTSERYQIRDFPESVLTYRSVLSDPAARDAAEACRAAGVTGRILLERCAFDIVVTGEDRFAESYRDLAEMLLDGAADGGDPPTLAELHVFGGFDESSLLLGGAATVDRGRLHLTGAEGFSPGSAFYPGPVRLADGVESTFAVSVTESGGDAPGSGGTGGSAFAFVISGAGPGSGDGPDAGSGDPGAEGVLAVEFDTSSGTAGGPASRLAITRVSSLEQAFAADRRSLARADLPSGLVDGAQHRIRIDVASDSIRVFVDGEAVLSADVRLSEQVRLQEGGGGWLGFVATTGGPRQRHSIHSWSFQSK